ncbi:MAG: outer membrane beta-barrel protein [Methylococcaceae bacterium]
MLNVVMKSIFKTVVLTTLTMLATAAHAQNSPSGLYVGADFGADTTLAGSAGFSYGANIGYRINNVFAIEGKYQSLASKVSSTSLSSSSVTSTGNLIDVLFLSDPMGITSGYFKLGYGKLSSKLDGTRSSLIGGQVVTTAYSTPFDTSAIVVGFGEETKGSSLSWGMRAGVDFYSQTSQTSGVNNPDLIANFYLAAIYYF